MAHKCQHGYSSVFLGSRDLLLHGTYVFRSRQGARSELLSQRGLEVVCSVLSVPQAFLGCHQGSSCTTSAAIVSSTYSLVLSRERHLLRLALAIWRVQISQQFGISN